MNRCILLVAFVLSPTVWADETLPNPLTSKVATKCVANQRYSDATEGKAGLCDVYLPKSDPPAEGRPVVLVIHGGAWTTGDKWTLEGYSRLLASHGFVAVTMNYRLAPQHKFPAQVDDVRQALIWTAKNAERFSIDLNRLGIFGYSAGGHLAAMVGTLADEPMAVRLKTGNWKKDDPRWTEIPEIHALCLGGAPCDFRDLPEDNTGLSYFLGGSRREQPERYSAASPVTHASAQDPVVQFLHGQNDFMVPIGSAQKMHQALKAAGVDVRFDVMPGQGHMMTFLNMKSRKSVLDFFQSVFVKPSLSNWDMSVLGRAPKMRWVNEDATIRELIYEGQELDGKPTEVFAFYATPGTIAGDPSLDKDLPAVVLVHGGGGTAFADWAWLWAKRGYAAIAMDLSGRRPQSPKFKDNGELILNLRVKRERLAKGGPEQGHDEKFMSVGEPVQNDWPYHAIGNVIRAHSLVRSFPSINAERTALTGISWGGYTTCITASVDDRFKAAVPVYGCGYLHDGESVQRAQIERLSTEKQALWISQYDPSAHLSNCRVPIFFVNGANDKHYPLRSYSRSYGLVPNSKSIRIEPGMRHSHAAGWAPKEIGLYIDSKIKDGKPLPQLSQIKVADGMVVVDYESVIPLKVATLHYTTDAGTFLKRKWQTAEATIEDKQIKARDIDDATIILVTATDQRDALVSTDVLIRR